MPTTVPPCKRPKVTIAPVVQYSPSTEGIVEWTAQVVTCAVPRCGFTYKAAVITDANQQATWHRQEHRAAVPKTWIERDPEYDVHCEPCGGHRRTFGTRVDAEAWLAHHLHADHGLVTC